MWWRKRAGDPAPGRTAGGGSVCRAPFLAAQSQTQVPSSAWSCREGGLATPRKGIKPEGKPSGRRMQSPDSVITCEG